MATPTDRDALVAGFTRADVRDLIQTLDRLAAAFTPSVAGTAQSEIVEYSAALADTLELLQHIADNG